MKVEKSYRTHRMASVPFKRVTLSLLAAALLTVGPAGATLLGPSSTVFPDLIATPAGTLLASTSVPFVASVGTYSGTLRAAVYLDATPLAVVCPTGGCLDFYYQVVNNATSRDPISRESNINFGGFLTSASFRTDGGALASGSAGFTNGTVPPMTADRDALGNVVGFNFNPPTSAEVLPGLTSTVVVIRTNATQFTSGFSSTIDGSVTTVPTFQPTVTTVIPEPGSFLLLGSGLLAVVFVTRRFALRAKQ